MNRLLKLHFIFLFALFMGTFSLSSLLYAQNESSNQPNNQQKSPTVGRELLRVNQAVSKELGRAADKIDRRISPRTIGEIEKNKTQIYFITTGDFDDRGDSKGSVRYGGQLHLPRFEKYWKVKFSNEDENRDRGRSSMTRERRERDNDDDFFVGVSFARRWEGIDVDYKPQLAYKNDSLGLDHSIEADTKFEFGDFHILPSLEFFANHKEGPGSSGAFGFRYFLTKSFSVGQSNDARYVFLEPDLAVNHSVGFGYTHNDRLNTGISYFRGFANSAVGGYMLAAYGYFLSIHYKLYQDILLTEVRPYIVYERPDDFKKTNGILISLRVNF